MKQALHIFAKDARRLWPQIAAVAILFAVYAFFSPETALTGGASLLEWNGIPAALVVLACWTLGASAMHEDAPAQESPFWLTRPYDRTSLVAAKVLLLSAFVFVPLLLAGVVLDVRAGASVFGNFGALLELCLGRSLWLILPGLAFGAVTRNLLDFSGACLASWVLLLLMNIRGFALTSLLYAPGNPLQNASVAAVLPMTAAGIAVLGLQFGTRRTTRSQGLIVAGVVLTGLLASSDSVASFSLRVLHPGFDPEQVQVSFDRGEPMQVDRLGNRFCINMPLKVQGLPNNMILHGVDGTAERIWPQYTIRNVGRAEIRETANGYNAVICPGPGVFRVEPPTLRATVHFEIVETPSVATIPVKRGVLRAGGAGLCEVKEDVTDYLRCTLAEPASGVMSAGLEYPGYRSFARGFGDDGTFRLSPALRRKFDGVSFDVPSGWPIEQALKRSDAHFVLRNERVISSIWRTFVYERFEMPWIGPPPPPPPPPPQKRPR